MASSIILTDLVSAFGDYYMNNGQNLTNLRSKFYTPGETSQSLVRVPTLNTQEQGAMVTQNSVLQGFQPAWTPMGDTEFKPHVISLFEQKIDLTYTAADLAKVERSWIGFLATLDTPDRSQWPFIRYLLEVHILQQRDEDYELQAIYKGVYADPTPGTPAPAAQSMNGLKQIFNDAITAGFASSIVLGAVPTDPVAFVTYVEAFVEGIPEIIRPMIKLIRMSHVLANRFKQGMRLKYNVYYAQANSLVTLIDYSTMEVRGFHSMSGSTKIIAAIDNNIVEFTKRPISESVFQIEVDKRSVNIYTDWWKGLGLQDPRYAFSNDVELNPPPEEG